MHTLLYNNIYNTFEHIIFLFAFDVHTKFGAFQRWSVKYHKAITMIPLYLRFVDVQMWYADIAEIEIRMILFLIARNLSVTCLHLYSSISWLWVIGQS